MHMVTNDTIDLVKRIRSGKLPLEGKDESELDEIYSKVCLAMQDYPEQSIDRSDADNRAFRDLGAFLLRVQSEIDSRHTMKTMTLAKQRHEWNRLVGFVCELKNALEELSDTQVDMIHVAPSPAMSQDELVAISYPDLVELQRQDRYYIDRARRELAMTSECSATLRALIDGDCLERWAAKLKARSEQLSETVFQRIQETEAISSELSRRISEHAREEREKEQLPETVRQLKEQLAELQQMQQASKGGLS